jgi:hypothetical protein
MRTLLAASVGAVLLILTIASLSAQAALICKDGYLHHGGSGFYANRLEAEASAIEAWRRVRAGNVGASRAAKSFPKSEQLHCARATTGEGWRCFVRGSRCHAT